MFVDIALQIIMENIKFETQLWSSSKKDPATRHVLKTKLPLKVSENI